VKNSEALRAQLKTDNADQRALLGALLTLSGLYGVTLGWLSYTNVKLSREEARDQIEDIRKQWTDRSKRLEDEIENLLKSRRSDLEELEAAIYRSLPDMNSLYDQIRRLLNELDRDVPADIDWNNLSAYNTLNAQDVQRILVGEMSIAALPIFVKNAQGSNRSSLAKLYRGLARFYLGRYVAATKDVQDAERAIVYAGKAVEIEPKDSESFRISGAIYLGLYRIQVSTAGGTDAAKTQYQFLLKNAIGNLEVASTLDKADLGTAYNLALAYFRNGNTQTAIEISDQAIKTISQVPDFQVTKFGPNLYRNTACYLAKLALTQAEEEKSRLEAEVFKVIEEGWKLFSSTKYVQARHTYYDVLMIELVPPHGDLSQLPRSVTEKINNCINNNANASPGATQTHHA